jgi:hypothetical protein
MRQRLPRSRTGLTYFGRPFDYHDGHSSSLCATERGSAGVIAAACLRPHSPRPMRRAGIAVTRRRATCLRLL